LRKKESSSSRFAAEVTAGQKTHTHKEGKKEGERTLPLEATMQKTAAQAAHSRSRPTFLLLLVAATVV
jgi:hypothetical protein